MISVNVSNHHFTLSVSQIRNQKKTKNTHLLSTEYSAKIVLNKKFSKKLRFLLSMVYSMDIMEQYLLMAKQVQASLLLWKEVTCMIQSLKD
jgi:hypothetical protein